MVNFGAYSSVPEKFKQRLLYKHNPEVTLMRTNKEENTQIGAWIANKINQCHGEIRFIIPEGGVSALDIEGQAFWDPDVDAALFSAITDNLQQTSRRKLITSKHHINSPEFAKLVVQQFNEIANLETQHHKELECQNMNG